MFLRIKRCNLKIYIWLVFVVALAIFSCSSNKIICNSPYIQVGESCCLDKNNDKICDSEEKECPEKEFDCSLCPPNVVTETKEVFVYRYFCEDGREVNSSDECRPQYEDVIFEPVTTNENGTVIEKFSIRSACRSGINGMELYYKVGTVPDKLEVEVKNFPEEPFRVVYTKEKPPFENYVYGIFCIEGCPNTADFTLEPGKKYLVRIKFDYTTIYPDKKRQLTNEHVADATKNGEYTLKLC